MRRFFYLLSLLTLLLGACSPDELTMLTGSYNGPDETGLRSFRFNQKTGEAVLLDSVRTRNPSYLVPSKSGRTVYAVGELTDKPSVSAFRFKKKKGSFRLLGTVPAGGGDPCYIATNGKMVVTADYGGSLSVYPIGWGGRLKACSQVFAATTGGPDPLRQDSPHMHCATVPPDGQYLYASDFSADRRLRFEVMKKSLAASADSSGTSIVFPVAPDSGPRHIVFSPDKKSCYVIGELSGNVSAFDLTEDGMLRERQTILADPYGGRGSADIRLSPDGKFLYASNRLVNDGIAVFSVGRDGLLEKVAHQATRIHPRNFVITPNGRYLLCACRDSDMIQVFRRDKKTGLLTDTGQNILLPKPVCIRFL